MANKMFFGGMPTAPDVRKLIKAFGRPAIGAEITHEQIEETLGVLRTANRYYSVTLAWRKQLLKDDNIDMGKVMGAGFRSLPENERVSNGISGVKQGVRKQMRSIQRATTCNTDDPVLQKTQGLLTRYGIAMQGEANLFLKQIGAPNPTAQMPRLVRGG